ncbi:MerR-family transcriptional regulator [Streptomyces venezuelae]|uniref:helix-turn-helix domain-containing protein n=1 Tax=Streptomyces gardneri TaxID=66892 RepID=UPI0006BCAD92|nr:MerR family transcriptional regulator [Streptomyces gardneri]ALO12936.1 MerR-family transcriptional regulator [Streptomyces venezuelae]QPK49630.1 MerR family transcriptional regulator [Streptomyces gardneri]WRK41181.1 MerR family transcriptional regulator [Streptomyces venezuelae]CUM36401.1 transcriptional regulator, MerR family [Streptomyces venezuelae]
MPYDEGLWSIGELAERAGATVKTVRFYSDRGLLPEAGRSSGGHRRYGPEALDRLRLIRSLRALDLPVPEVERVLDRDEALDEALEEAVSGQLCEVESRLAALRWREASLLLLRDCPAGERAERLRLVGAVAAPPDTAALARFWRRTLPVRLPARTVATVLDSVVPRPPREPSPAQVLAFARLHELVTDPRLDRPEFRPAPPLPDGEYRPVVLYEGLAEAYALASSQERAGLRPGDDGALDCFVSAYAHASGVRDTPAFRRRLLGLLARSRGPVIHRYWKLATGLFAPDEPVLGALHHHLSVALHAEVEARAV